MDSLLLAHIGLSRLRLPIPMVKLQVIHGAAAALQGQEAHASVMRQALDEWIAGLELESEVLEALCIPLLADNSSTVTRSSIPWPSILSDVFLSRISDLPTLIPSWTKSHSGEAPTYFSADSIERELRGGKIAPRILWNRLAALERSSGKPFIKQWVYEFDRLLSRVNIEYDGHWSYFSDNRQGSVGQFIGRRSHIARSAFLRTLALAYDQWGMPERTAEFEAMFATPVDFSFLKMLPGDPPSWAVPFQNALPISAEDWGKTLCEVAQAVSQQENGRLLLHLNAPIRHRELFRADAELITVLHNNEISSVANCFQIHDWLLGEYYVERSQEGQFVIGKHIPDAFFPLGDGSFMLPALLPLVERHVGYIHSDLIGRMPYLPANYSYAPGMKTTPRLGGADIDIPGETIGEFSYWNSQWAPTHNKALGTPCAVSVTLSKPHVEQALQVAGMRYSRLWRVTTLTRESEYDEWQETKYFGVIPKGTD